MINVTYKTGAKETIPDATGWIESAHMLALVKCNPSGAHEVVRVFPLGVVVVAEVVDDPKPKGD